MNNNNTMITSKELITVSEVFGTHEHLMHLLENIQAWDYPMGLELDRKTEREIELTEESLFAMLDFAEGIVGPSEVDDEGNPINPDDELVEVSLYYNSTTRTGKKVDVLTLSIYDINGFLIYNVATEFVGKSKLNEEITENQSIGRVLNGILCGIDEIAPYTFQVEEILDELEPHPEDWEGARALECYEDARRFLAVRALVRELSGHLLDLLKVYGGDLEDLAKLVQGLDY